MGFAVLFPGQGSQTVGMGRDLFEARSDLLGETADEILGWSLEDMCLKGPDETLTRTEHAQPALFALSYALWSEFSDAIGRPPSAGTGHSLGEYTALAAAGALGFDAALSLVAERGRAMADAADQASSGMAALIGADEAAADRIVSERNKAGGSLAVANLNAPGQVVVAGGSEDIEWIADNFRDLGVRRAIPLKVAGAFHTAFMAPAVSRVEAALTGVEIAEPSFPVWSNTTAAPHTGTEIAATLARQVVEPVRFSASLMAMAETGVDTFVHVGPGDVTAGMARRTVEGATVLTVSSLDDVAPALEALSTMP